MTVIPIATSVQAAILTPTVRTVASHHTVTVVLVFLPVPLNFTKLLRHLPKLVEAVTQIVTNVVEI